MAIVQYKGKRWDSGNHLDAGEAMTFLRQLESVDETAYQQLYPALMAQQLIPPESGVQPWAHTRTYRQYDRKGIAALISSMSDDLPLAEESGQEFTSYIKPFGMAYQYNVDEIQAAAATNIPIDQMRGANARWACERQVDQVLATGTVTMQNGSTINAPGLLGLLNQTGTTAFTAGTKQQGGTTWGTIAAPNATGDEVAADIMGACNNLFEATQQLFAKFRVLVNPKQYDYAAMKRLGSVSDTTALAFAKANCSYIEDVYPWWQIPVGTMCVFAPSPLVAAAVVPMQWTPEAPQARNLTYVIPSRIRCGGVISRYPVAISYVTGL